MLYSFEIEIKIIRIVRIRTNKIDDKRNSKKEC
jgi:hypothetical protein